MRSLAMAMTLWMSWLAGSALAGGGPEAPTPGGVLTGAVGPRRAYSLWGFSICPPSGAQAARKGDLADLAAFTVADPNSRQVLLSMRILRGAELKESVDNLEAYGAKLVRQLAIDQDFHVEGGGRLSSAAGKPALELSGRVSQGRAERFRRDLWVMVQPKEFLVLQFVGPAGQRAAIERAAQASVDTLELFDPAPIRQKHQQDRQRAQALLERLTRQQVLSVLAREDYWLAVLRDGKLAGFMHVREGIGHHDKIEGARLIIRTGMINEDGTRTLSRQDLFSSPDRVTERWELFSITLTGQKETARQHQFGLKHHDRLVAQEVSGPHDTISRQQKVPEEIYLPLALSSLLPRLMDRSAPAAYAFAQYDPAAEEMAMRIIAVKGPTTATLGGTAFSAVELSDQSDVDAPPTRLFVDETGLPLMWASTDHAGRQIVVQRTTGEAIRQRFGDELKRFETK